MNVNKKDKFRRLARLAASEVWQKDLRPYLEKLKRDREESKREPTTEFEAMKNEIARLTTNKLIDNIIGYIERANDLASKFND